MNIKKLIEQLSKYDEKVMVVLPGYEDYYDEVNSIKEINLLLDAFKPKGWGGKHFDALSNEGRKAISEVPTRPIVKGVLLDYIPEGRDR